MKGTQKKDTLTNEKKETAKKTGKKRVQKVKQ